MVHPIAEADAEDLVLPSTLQAYVESPIYARTNGYLKKWYHDIGSRVRQGELLADIDTPEIAQQLEQSRAELGTAQANQNLSQITASRYEGLLKSDSVSKQEADNATGDLAAKRANTQSAEANVRRLQEIGIVPAHLRAVQRSHHAAQRGYRKPDQCRKWRLGAAIVLFGADRSYSRVRERAGKLCAVYSQGTGSLPGAGAISRTEILRGSGAHLPMPLT